MRDKIWHPKLERSQETTHNVSNDSEQALLSKVIVTWNRHSGSLWEHLEGR